MKLFFQTNNLIQNKLEVQNTKFGQMNNLYFKFIYTFSLLFLTTIGFSQIEVNGSFSGTRIIGTMGFGTNVGYEIPFNNERIGIKPQIGYKCNCWLDNRSDVDLKNKITDLHTTVFYKLVQRSKYELIPNAGLNLRYSKWSAINSMPSNQRVTYIASIRDDKDLIVFTPSNTNETKLDFLTSGFSIQAQNRFLLNEKIAINVTPFLEFDATREHQPLGGGYFGIIYNR